MPPHLQGKEKAKEREIQNSVRVEEQERLQSTARERREENGKTEKGKSVSEEMERRIVEFVEMKARQQQEIGKKTPLGGCMCTAEAVKEWEKIGGLNILALKIGLTWNELGPPQGKGRKSRTVNGEKEEKAYQVLLEEMLKEKVIEEVREEKILYYNHTFLVKKSDGGFRFVLDAKALNMYVNIPHYKNEDIRTVLDLLQPGDVMVKFDLKSAYHQVAVTEEASSYLGFAVGERSFRFLALPFGLATAPFLFTKIMKPVVTWMRLKWRGIMYLDDGIMLFRNVEEAEAGMKEMVEMLMRLKIRISFEKSELMPTRIIKFLGWIINSEMMIVSIPAEKGKACKRKVKEWKHKVTRGAVVRVRTLASFIGTLSSLALVVPQAHLRLAGCQALKDEAVRLDGWEGTVKMGTEIIADLEWWEATMEGEVQAVIKTFSPILTITTDASPVGWGAQIEGGGRYREVRGNWGPEMKEVHSNVKEMMAVRWALLEVEKGELMEEHGITDVLIRSDNSTVIYDLIRRTCAPSLREEMIGIMEIAERNKMRLRSSHIQGMKNTVADLLSRVYDAADYSVTFDCLDSILEIFNTTIVIDLFAATHNAKTHRFYSFGVCAGSLGTDALAYSWKNEKGTLYAFPPILIIEKVLKKLKADGGKMIIITPQWRNAVWGEDLRRMMIGQMVLGRITEFATRGHLLPTGSQDPPGVWVASLIRA
jgi:hypothetical protein